MKFLVPNCPNYGISFGLPVSYGEIQGNKQ